MTSPTYSNELDDIKSDLAKSFESFLEADPRLPHTNSSTLVAAEHFIMRITAHIQQATKAAEVTALELAEKKILELRGSTDLINLNIVLSVFYELKSQLPEGGAE